MDRFAARTGLTQDSPSHRNLWTDAFAVCNWLSLYDASHQDRFLRLALHLVDQVHHALGKHRFDDTRHGWLSGLTGAEAEAHPTLGGLRIGKSLPEDGQSFHYLTQWMHALDQLARRTREARYNLWARELAQVAFRAFSYTPSGKHHLE